MRGKDAATVQPVEPKMVPARMDPVTLGRSCWHIAPRLGGERSRQVLTDWLGYEANETARLESDDVLFDRPPRMSRPECRMAGRGQGK